MQQEALAADLRALGVPGLPPAWVSAVWDGSFCDIPEVHPLEDPLSASETCQRLAALTAGLAAWSDAGGEGAQPIWLFLVEAGIDLRGLVALLAYYTAQYAEAPRLAATAAHAYVCLLMQPGSAAHQVPTGMVLRNVLKTMSPWPAPASSSSARGSGGGSGGAKRKAASPAAERSAKRRDGEEAGDAPPEGATAPPEVLLPLLRDFVLLLQQNRAGSLGDFLDAAVRTLVQVSQAAPAAAAASEADFLAVDAAALPASADAYQSAFFGLRLLCAPAPAEGQSAGVRTVFKHLLPSITMRYTAVTANVVKQVRAVQATAVAFVTAMARRYPHVQPSVCLLMQHICTTTPDREEYREAAAEAVGTLTAALTPASVAGFLAWATKCSRSARVAHRVLAVGVLSKIAQRLLLAGEGAAGSQAEPAADAPSPTGETPGETPGASPPACAAVSAQIESLLDTLVHRSSDKAASVRAKALAHLAALFRVAGSAESARHYVDRLLTSAALHAATGLSSPDGGGLLPTIRRRAADPKSIVRRAAIQAIGAIAAMPNSPVAADEMDTLHRRCMDSVPTVRRQAMQTFTDLLLRFPERRVLHQPFLNAVLPLVMDREDSVRNACLDVLDTVLLRGVTAAAADASDPAGVLAWKLFAVMDTDMDMRRYVQRACAVWLQTGRLSPDMVNAVATRALSSDDRCGWVLLQELSSRVPEQLSVSAIRAAWVSADPDETVVCSSILGVVANTARCMPEEAARDISGGLRQRLRGFDLPAPLVPAAMHAVMRLDQVIAGQAADAVSDATLAFAGELLHLCERELAAAQNKPASAGGMDEYRVARQLFTLGEAAIMCPGKITRGHVLVVEALIVAEGGDEAVGATPASVRAHAYLALGKLCLQQDELAKKWVPAMARELAVCPDPAVRNNIVVIMSDLCIRYTSIVQRYVDSLANCLRDPSPLVRRQVLTLLTRLLSEDYIKMKGALFFRLVVSLVDRDEHVRKLANFCIINLLLVKNPALISAHFVEAVYHFNGVHSHPKYNRFEQSEAENEGFDLTGAANRSRREFLYRQMLEHCPDFDKLQITQALCQDVLGGVVDGAEVDGPLFSLLSDSLTILASKDIKLASQRTASEAEVEASEAAAAEAGKAKSALISKLVKRNLAENIVPIIIALKNVLEQRHSPLQRPLMLYLREVMRDYKEEVQDILAADKQLAAEIIFDINKLEAETKSRRESIASMAATPTAATPNLRNATPQTSPFAPANLPLTPRTPGFAAPKVRGKTTGKPSRLSISASASAGVSAFQTPLTPAPTAGSAAVCGGASPLPAAATPLAWVRTPRAANARQQPITAAAASKAVLSEVPDDIICLESPARAAAEPKPQQWDLQPIDFGKPLREKRFAVEDVPGDDILDENTEANIPPAAAKARASLRSVRAR